MTVFDIVVKCEKGRSGECTRSGFAFPYKCPYVKDCEVFQQKYGTTPDLFELDPRYKKEWLKQIGR